jgi:hypothetical protein
MCSFCNRRYIERRKILKTKCPCLGATPLLWLVLAGVLPSREQEVCRGWGRNIANSWEPTLIQPPRSQAFLEKPLQPSPVFHGTQRFIVHRSPQRDPILRPIYALPPPPRVLHPIALTGKQQDLKNAVLCDMTS